MCLKCRRSGIQVEETIAICRHCKSTFPVLRGVIDFRDADRDLSAGYDFASDNLLAQKLSDVFDRARTAHELRRLLWRLRVRARAGTDLAAIDAADVLTEDAIEPMSYSDEDLSHGRSVLQKCDLYLADAGIEPPPAGVALEDGAGEGYFFAGIAERYHQTIVLDLSMALMLVAVKTAEELGLSNVTFICASAENLPLADGTVDFVHNNNVIEHVADQGKMISEAGRVLTAEGLMFIISPNRFSIYFEPHFRLAGFGFFPPSLRRIIVKRWLGSNTGDVALRSLGELRALLRSNFDGRTWLTFIPRNLQSTVTGGKIRSALTRLLSGPRSGPIANFVVNRLALAIMPYHVVLGSKRTS